MYSVKFKMMGDNGYATQKTGTRAECQKYLISELMKRRSGGYCDGVFLWVTPTGKTKRPRIGLGEQPELILE